MKSVLRKWFTPPVFDDDQEKTWRAGILNNAINVCLLIVIIVTIGNFVGGTTPVSVLVIDGVMLVVLLLIRFIYVQGKIFFASIVLVSMGIIMISAASFSLGTIRAPNTTYLLLMVIIAGMLFGRWGLILSFLSTSLVVLGLVILENAGMLPKPDYTVTISHWVSFTAAFGLTGALTYFSYKSLQQALQHSQVEMTERKRAQEAYEKLINYSLQAFVIFQDEKFIFVNSEAERLTGYTRDELYAMSPDEVFGLVPEEYRDERLRTFRERIAGEELPDRLEMCFTRKDGEVRWLESFTSVINYQGKPALQAAYLDVTDRKRIEERLKLQSTALNSAANSIVITDPKGVIIWANQAFASITGYSVDEVIGESPRVVKSGVHDKSFYEDMWSTILSGKVWFGKLTNKRKDGSLYIEEMTITPVQNESGDITHFIAVKQDITDRVRVEDALYKSEMHYRALFDNLPIPVFTKNLDGEYLSSNTENLKFWDDNPIGRTDFDLLPHQIASALRNTDLAVINSGKILTQEERLTNTPLGDRQMLSRKVPLRDPDGNIVGILGASIDITENKNAERKLRAANEQLKVQLSKIKALEATMREQAIRDPLTGLFNRHYMEEVFSQEISKALRRNEPLSIVFVDLDHLKKINDTHGHLQGGDQALKVLANTLTQMCRAEDIVCRYGGDEFLLLLYNTETDIAYQRALDWKKAISMLKLESDVGEFQFSFTAGIATFPKHGQTRQNILMNADRALYHAKTLGRNRVVVFEKETHSS